MLLRTLLQYSDKHCPVRYSIETWRTGCSKTLSVSRVLNGRFLLAEVPASSQLSREHYSDGQQLHLAASRGAGFTKLRLNLEEKLLPILLLWILRVLGHGAGPVPNFQYRFVNGEVAAIIKYVHLQFLLYDGGRGWRYDGRLNDSKSGWIQMIDWR